MANYIMSIETSDEDVKKILDELEEAKQKIWDCYSKLRMLGVLKIEKSPSDGTNGEDA